MNTYTVSFFGHRIIDDPLRVEKEVEKVVCQLIMEHEYVVFLVGRNGDFDQIVASTVRRVKRTVRSDNSSLVLVLPYLTAEYRDNEESFRAYYDEIEIYSSPNKVHFKAAIQNRNRDMVDRSDVVVFCVNRTSGGAAQTRDYAMRTHTLTVNIGL